MATDLDHEEASLNAGYGIAKGDALALIARCREAEAKHGSTVECVNQLGNDIRNDALEEAAKVVEALNPLMVVVDWNDSELVAYAVQEQSVAAIFALKEKPDAVE